MTFKEKQEKKIIDFSDAIANNYFQYNKVYNDDFGINRLLKQLSRNPAKEEFYAYVHRNPNLTLEDIKERVLDKKRNPLTRKATQWFLKNVETLKQN